MTRYDPSIVCCYLYPISKYGYPPPADRTVAYLTEMHDLGFRSVELEGIRERHLLDVYERRSEIRDALDGWSFRSPASAPYCPASTTSTPPTGRLPVG